MRGGFEDLVFERGRECFGEQEDGFLVLVRGALRVVGVDVERVVRGERGSFVLDVVLEEVEEFVHGEEFVLVHGRGPLMGVQHGCMHDVCVIGSTKSEGGGWVFVEMNGERFLRAVGGL